MRDRAIALDVPAEDVQQLVERLRGLPATAEAEEWLQQIGDDRRALPAAVAQMIDDGQAGFSDVLAMLGSLPDVGSVVIQGLVASRSADAAPVLLRIASSAVDKDVIKAARRGLHQLAGVGIGAGARPVPSGVAVFRPVTPGIAWARALAGPYDEGGQRFVMLAQATLPVGATMAVSVISEQEGLLIFQAVSRTHRQLEKEWDEYRRTEEANAPVEIPFDYAQWLLAEAAQVTSTRGVEQPEDYTAWQEVAGGVKAGISPHLIYDEVGVDADAPSASALTSSDTLLTEPEIEWWTVPIEPLTSYGVELLQARSSTLVVSEAAQADRERQIIARAADAVFTADLRQRCKRRLEEVALIFARTNRSVQATGALAAAVVLGMDDRAPSSVPFVMGLVERAVAAAAEVAAPASQAGREALTRLYTGR